MDQFSNAETVYLQLKHVWTEKDEYITIIYKISEEHISQHLEFLVCFTTVNSRCTYITHNTTYQHAHCYTTEPDYSSKTLQLYFEQKPRCTGGITKSRLQTSVESHKHTPVRLATLGIQAAPIPGSMKCVSYITLPCSEYLTATLAHELQAFINIFISSLVYWDPWFNLTFISLLFFWWMKTI